MRLFFLAGPVPLTKSFTRLPNGEIEKSVYPHVRLFTSHEREVDTPLALYDTLQQHAALGHCILKGQIKRALTNESRAGSTQPLDPTSWSCFDLDGVHEVESAEDFIRQVLPKSFYGVDYVLQYSASAGITPNGGLRAHLFFLHDTAFTPEAAKLWITELNLTNALLAAQLELSANGMALKFPLDRTVVQNDKLIYIAPPMLIGDIHDPYKDKRITLVTKGKPGVSFDWRTVRSPAAIDALAHAKIDELRLLAGLKRKTAKVVVHSSGELLLKNPDVAAVTGERQARGFTYLNLNHGDSWGYFYSALSPKYLRNFKGEPMVVLKEFLPEYYSQVSERLTQKKQGRIRVPFAFRHAETDTIWNGVYDTVADRLILLAPTSRQSLKDFFGQHDEDVPQIDDWRFEFEPTNLTCIDFDKKFCNRWIPTDYIRDVRTSTVIPPLIHRVILSAVGFDEECYHHLLNWIAYIFQFRTKTMTAWVLHGVEGTGKGTLFHHVLTPLFGSKYCLMKQTGSLEDRFNAELETCLLYALDESQAESSPQGERAVAKMRNMITEPVLESRGMHQNARQCASYTNYLLYSNNYDAYKIADSDRRFNVAPRQETKLILTDADIVAIEAEVTDFAAFLHGYPVDVQQAHTALNNTAKAQMREASQDAIDEMCHAIQIGNLKFFLDHAEEAIGQNTNPLAYANYRETVKGWLANVGVKTVIRSKELMAAYVYLFNPPVVPGPNKFIRMLKHRNLKADTHRCDGLKDPVHGFRSCWQATPEQVERGHAVFGTKEKQPHASVTNITEWKKPTA